MILTEQELSRVADIVNEHSDTRGALLPILHAIQHEFGYIPKPAIPIMAQALLQTEAEIYGVITFYHHFNLNPTGRFTVEVCRGEACQAMGSRALEDDIKSSLSVDYGKTTDDKRVTLKEVFCLGNCACSPSIRIDDRVYGRMDANKLEQTLERLESQVVSLDAASTVSGGKA